MTVPALTVVINMNANCFPLGGSASPTNTTSPGPKTLGVTLGMGVNVGILVYVDVPAASTGRAHPQARQRAKQARTIFLK
jgi:hypothetical protein